MLDIFSVMWLESNDFMRASGRASGVFFLLRTGDKYWGGDGNFFRPSAEESPVLDNPTGMKMD